MQPSSFCAIDPGASGGYVVRNSAGTVVSVGAYHEPADVVKVVKWMKGMAVADYTVAAVIEKVWASPVMGVASAFSFGENYGAWVMAFRAHGIPVYAVTPQQWQRVMAPDIDGQGQARKAALKVQAAKLFPEIKPTLAICDALLISEYVLRRMAERKPLGEQL